ncbi:MAG: hypothetical protein JNK57_20785 [Planctomycetaceae bacterium]|nr:hypothetical protein [Planctomycetaceae bacterium]
MRMDDGRKVGAVQFQASSLEEISRTSSSYLSITHGVGTQFGITEASDEVTTNHTWTNKQISNRSEYREYAAPTAAPPTTMAALRTNSPSSNQALLGTAPTGSSLVQESNHSTLYYSPLSDVTKTVKNWIESYTSDGGITAAPILYRYLDEVNVNVTATVTKTGYVFNGSSTLRSKSTFTESDQGTIETYRGLERQDGNSFNNWTVTYVPVETHTGGITQSITHTKPAADNTITVPNQGTNTTVDPVGEYHSGTTTLSTYLTVQKPMADFVGEFTTKTGYVSTSVTTSSNGGSSDDDYSQTSGGSGAQDGDSEISLNLGDLKNLSDQELAEAIKLFFIMHEGLTPDFEAFEAMCNEGFIRVDFYRSSPYFFDLHSGTDSRPIPGTHTDGPHYFWRIYLDRNEIEKHGLAWAVTEFRKRLETLNSYPYGDRSFRNRRKLFADSLNASTLAGTPSAANSAAQDEYFQGLASEPQAALAAAAREAEKELMLLGERGVLLIRMTPHGGFVLAVVDCADNRITFQYKVAGVGLGVLGIAGIIRAARTAAGGTHYAHFNKTHIGSLPRPKGTGPNGGLLQSHHGLQKQWATENLHRYGYNLDLAPTVTIETGIGFPHTVISNAQNARRNTRVAAGLGKWSSTLQEELQYIVDDLTAAGYSRSTIERVLEQQYGMLDRLGVPYSRIVF